MYGSLLVAVAAVSLVSCTGTESGTQSGSQSVEVLDAPARSPVNVNFSCNGGVNTIGLVDNAGRQAWLIEMVNREIEWVVPQQVTIDSIRAKSGELPIEPDTSNRATLGKSFKGRAKNGIPNGNRKYPYLIALTCQPSGAGSTPVKLIIDPEMIVR